MARFNLLSLAVSVLMISFIVLVQCEEAEPTEEAPAEPAEKAESQPAEEGKFQETESSESASAEKTAPEAESAREDEKSTSIGEEKRQDSNETVESRKEGDGPSGSKDRSLWERWNDFSGKFWPNKFCPKGFYDAEKLCILHCWHNGWQGGRCTSSQICVCLWDGLKEDPDATEKPWVNTPSTKKPNVSTGKPKKDNQIEAREAESDEKMEGVSSNTTTIQNSEKSAEDSSVSPSEESPVSAAEEASDSPHEEAEQQEE